MNSNPLARALAYDRQGGRECWSNCQRVANHQAPLQVYLGGPAVPIDTNHPGRALRVIPMGRKNRLFCWTEVGAEQVGIVQSQLTSCRLQGVDPYTWLVAVQQRADLHPASRVIELTPRLWKEKFAENPLRSDLVLAGCQ